MVDGFRELALPDDEFIHPVVIHRFQEGLVDGFVLLEQVHDLLHAFLHDFEHGLVVVELRLLLQIAHRIAGCEDHFAVRRGLDPGDDLHHRRFAGAVQTDDPDLGPIEEGEIDVLEDYFVVVRQDLAHTVHREDDLFVGHGCQFRLSVAAADSI